MKPTQYFFCLIILFSISSFTPKVKYKNGIIYKDEVVYFKSNWDKLIKAHEIRNSKDSLFLLVKNQMYTDQSLISNSNRTGRVDYVEAKFPGKDSVLFELDAIISAKAKMKKLAKLFIKYNVIDSVGNINHANMVKMGNDIGKPHSRRRSEMRY